MGLLQKNLLPIAWLAVLLTLSACSNDPSRVQVVDKTTNYNRQVKITSIPHSGKVVQAGSYTPVNRGQHVVKNGETLYSLAFDYGRDWRELARDNNIAAPYTIYPGQIINLAGRTVTTTTPIQSTGGVKVTTTTKTPTATTKPTASQSTKPTAPKPTTAVVGGWTWPAIGTVISTYSPTGSLNKGIDIAAKEGTTVMAASAGTVVYAGNNLHGYGNLLIIKHNDNFVSAYGHNRSLLVKEGQRVSAGQKIAEMGSTGADRVKLHFEIRLNGKPVDPIKYLPKK